MSGKKKKNKNVLIKPKYIELSLPIGYLGIKLKMAPGLSTGLMGMGIQDTCITFCEKDDKRKRKTGHIISQMGGGIEISICDNKTKHSYVFGLSTTDLFNQALKAYKDNKKYVDQCIKEHEGDADEKKG